MNESSMAVRHTTPLFLSRCPSDKEQISIFFYKYLVITLTLQKLTSLHLIYTYLYNYN